MDINKNSVIKQATYKYSLKLTSEEFHHVYFGTFTKRQNFRFSKTESISRGHGIQN